MNIVTFLSKECLHTMVSKGDPGGDSPGFANDKVENPKGVPNEQHKMKFLRGQNGDRTYKVGNLMIARIYRSKERVNQGVSQKL